MVCPNTTLVIVCIRTENKSFGSQIVTETQMDSEEEPVLGGTPIGKVVRGSAAIRKDDGNPGGKSRDCGFPGKFWRELREKTGKGFPRDGADKQDKVSAK